MPLFVTCIKGLTLEETQPELRGKKVPEVGDRDLVTEEVEYNGGVFYSLAAYPPQYGFHVSHFATLPEETATEMYETEIEGILF